MLFGILPQHNSCNYFLHKINKSLKVCKDLHGFNLTLSSSSAAAAATSLSAGGCGDLALIEERKSEQMSMFKTDYTPIL